MYKEKEKTYRIEAESREILAGNNRRNGVNLKGEMSQMMRYPCKETKQTDSFLAQADLYFSLISLENQDTTTLPKNRMSNWE